MSALELPPKRGCWRSVTTDHILGGRTPFEVLTHLRCFMNGSIHWVIQELPEDDDNGVAMLLVFDCKEEVFKTMELPEAVRRLRIDWISTEGGMLWVWALKEARRENVVWMMHQYGVASSWRELTEWSHYRFITMERNCFKLHGKYGDQVRDDYDWMDRSQQPLNGQVFEPSLFLLDDANVVHTLPLDDSVRMV